MNQLASEAFRRICISRPKMPGYDWSFSGLKTQVLRFLSAGKQKIRRSCCHEKEDICASVREPFGHAHGPLGACGP